MTIRLLVLFGGACVLACALGLGAAPAIDSTQFPASYVPSGKQMYSEYCAVCHGADGKGNGPLAISLKTHAPDLTTLAERHGGKFPYDYVASVLKFGPGVPAHGSAEMPTWGPLFRYFDKQSEKAVRQRIKNLSDYLASLQGK